MKRKTNRKAKAERHRNNAQSMFDLWKSPRPPFTVPAYTVKVFNE